MTKQTQDKHDPINMSDIELREFVRKIIDTPEDFDDEIDPEERQKMQMRVEAKRFFANRRRDIRLSVSAPLVTDSNTNPLYDCVTFGDTQQVRLLLSPKDSVPFVVDGTIRSKIEKSVESNQKPIVEVPKKESKVTDSGISLPAASMRRKEATPDTSKLADFWFELSMPLPEGFSIVAATLFENRLALLIDQFTIHSPIPESTAKAVAHFDCESNPSNPNQFDLYCYSSWDRVTNLSSVLVLQVKEASK